MRPAFDPREALFVLLAVCLENRVVGLFFSSTAGTRRSRGSAARRTLPGARSTPRSHGRSAGTSGRSSCSGARSRRARRSFAANSRSCPARRTSIKQAQRPGSTGSKAQRDRLKSEQFRISRLVVMVVFRRLLLRFSTGRIHVQHTFQNFSTCFLVSENCFTNSFRSKAIA